MKEPYYMKDHIHCWDQKSPACGLAEHTKCCLCEKPQFIKIRDSRLMVTITDYKELSRKGVNMEAYFTDKHGHDHLINGHLLEAQKDTILEIGEGMKEKFREERGYMKHEGNDLTLIVWKALQDYMEAIRNEN